MEHLRKTVNPPTSQHNSAEEQARDLLGSGFHPETPGTMPIYRSMPIYCTTDVSS